MRPARTTFVIVRGSPSVKAPGRGKFGRTRRTTRYYRDVTLLRNKGYAAPTITRMMEV